MPAMNWSLCVLFSLFALAGCTRGVDDDVVRAQMNGQGLAGQRAVAADRWMEQLNRFREAGEPTTPEFVDQLVNAARQKAIARADASDEPAARQAAYREYRDFCGEMLRRIEREADTKDRQKAQLRYGIADAEWRMAQVAP
jgi:hypothetical protein